MLAVNVSQCLFFFNILTLYMLCKKKNGNIVYVHDVYTRNCTLFLYQKNMAYTIHLIVIVLIDVVLYI